MHLLLLHLPHRFFWDKPEPDYMELTGFLTLFCFSSPAKKIKNVSGHNVTQKSLLKKTPAKVLSCEYCNIFKNTYFEEHLRTATSVFCFGCCGKNKILCPFQFKLFYLQNVAKFQRSPFTILPISISSGEANI